MFLFYHLIVIFRISWWLLELTTLTCAFSLGYIHIAIVLWCLKYSPKFMAPARKKSVKAVAVAASNLVWNTGELVLAKVKGHPWWPAKVHEPFLVYSQMGKSNSWSPA